MNDTVTFLFTDIEGSTRLWDADARQMSGALAKHDVLARAAVEDHRGVVVRTTGDGMYAAFGDPADALSATIALQRALADPALTNDVALRVRCGLHKGVVERRDNDFFGPPVNRAARIMSAAHGGQVLLSRAVVDSVGEALPSGISLRDLGRVRLKDLSTPEHVFQLVHPDLRQDFPPLRSLEATPNNLSQQVTSFVGRKRESVEIKKSLESARLVTLTGLGGIGKTRLSLQVAADLIDHYADGVWLVELAQVNDPLMVPQTLASVLSVKEEGGRPVVEALVKYVADRNLLIVLDNCDHLIQPSAELASALLRAGPQVRIIATSREPLRVAGETTYPVPALAIPELMAKTSIEASARFEAVQLFRERALAALPAFAITKGNAAVVHAVCHRLAGIPLAIELAAARVRTFSVENINARLSDRFRLLTGGDRTALPRHQTLRASIDWSYDLLSEPERALFARLSIFVGGFTLEGAERVCSGDGLHESEIIGLLAQLVEKSLVAVDTDGRRYRLLETVRQYAQERAIEFRMLTASKERHLAYYVAFAERARTALFGPMQTHWLANLDQELENLLAAHAAYDSLGLGSDLGFRLVNALKNYWTSRGLLTLGHRVTAEMLARPSAQRRDSTRSRALFDAGWIAYLMGRYAEAQRHLEESVAIARELGDDLRLGAALQPLGMACLAQGNAADARSHLDEALVRAQRLGDRRDVAAALNQLAQLHRSEGALARAESLYGDALAIARELGDRESIAVALLNLAMVAIGGAAIEPSRRMLIDVLAIVTDGRSKPLVQSLLDVCAGLATLRGDYEAAARFFGAAEVLAGQIALRRDFADEAFLMPLIDRARNSLGVSEFHSAETAGRGLSLDDAIAETTAWLERA
jgi:predicted ATPase/class 3 adenylate cyclase